MEQILLSTETGIKTGQCVPKQHLSKSGITPTEIDCFEYSPYLLYQQGNRRFVLQPLPYDQYKVIKIYNFVPARYS